MAVIAAIAWPLRLLAVGLATVGFGAGIYFAVQAGDGVKDDVVVAGTATGSPATETPPLGTATAAPATQPPTQPPTSQPTPIPTLAPPPPHPDEPTPADDYTLVGGQWYRLACVDFYLPTGWTFTVRVGVGDPGGGFYGFSEDSSDSAVFFSSEGLAELGRTVNDPALAPAFDEIASTIQVGC